MLRKRLFVLIATIALFSLSAAAVLAQSGQLRGTVKFKQADGTTVPAAGADIDVYRTDVAGEYKTKTNKRGEWVFAGLPFIGTYTIAASMPNARPDFLPGAKAGRDQNFEILLTPGDGKRLTFAEVKAATGTATSGGGGESAADKAKREEMLKANAEREASNKKVGEAMAIINRTFKGGNDAIGAARVAKTARNFPEASRLYTEAITQFTEGLVADPEQIALLTNKATALDERGVISYNDGILSKDQAAKTAGIENAKNDFRAAVEAATKATELAKKQPAVTDAEEMTRQNARKYYAIVARSEAMRLLVTLVDPTQTDVGLAAFQEHLALETDAVKKKAAHLAAAKMLFDAGAADKASVEYKKILEADPNNVDALYWMGLVDINLGYSENDKAKLQDGVNNLQRFVDVAPDTHENKTGAKEVIAQMKSTEKVEPVKSTPPRRPGRRP